MGLNLAEDKVKVTKCRVRLVRICREWLNKWNTEKTCVFYSQPLAYDGNSKARSLCGVDGS